MKKAICFLAVVCLACALILPNTAFAANGPAFAVSSASVKAGEKAKIKISIKNNPGICSAKFEVAFDGDLTLNAVTYGSAFNDKAQQPGTLTSPVVLNWFAGLSNVKANGEFATLTFTVSKTAANGKHDIKITYDADDVFNVNEDNINFAVENGTVTVSGGSASSSASGKNSNDSSAKSSSPAKDASQNSSATTSAETSSGDANDTPVTDAKSGDEGDGDALLGEITFDEDGNEIDFENKEESAETVGASAEKTSSKTTILVCLISAAVLLIGAAALFALRKKIFKK